MLTSFARRSLYCAALLPLACLSLVAVLVGRARVAAGWWSRLRARLLGTAEAADRPGALVVAGHAVASLLLGATALVPFGVLLAFVVRGVFYGLVDHGPYDTSWGGPTRAGAWAAHFLIGLPTAAASVLLLAGIATLHGRLTTMLTGRRPAPGVLAVALVLPLPAVALLIAWLHQI